MTVGGRVGGGKGGDELAIHVEDGALHLKEEELLLFIFGPLD